MRRGVLTVCLAMSLGVACAGGPHLERHKRKPAAPVASSSTSASVAPNLSPSMSTSAELEKGRALRLAYAAFGCFVGGAWVEALGSLGEERTLATIHRCRTLSTEALGAKPEDEAALNAARTIDAKAVDTIVAKIGEPELVAVVRATADAAREASNARKISESLRKDKGAKLDEALGAKSALEGLNAVKSKTAKLVALVLAADHVESSRGLSPRAKILAAAPAFEIVFGVARPAGDDWLAYVTAAAKAGGHANAENTEQAAFAGVVTAFADKLEALAKELPPGEPQEVASGYAKRLRMQLSEAAKKK